jgi:phage recombination protein Bet
MKVAKYESFSEEQMKSVHRLGYQPETMGMLARLFDKDIPFTEIETFLYRCQALGLNPLLKQIYIAKKLKRYDDGTVDTTYTYLISIDAARLLADKTGRYAPGSKTEFELGVDSRPVLATASVAIYHEGSQTWREVQEEAAFSEYARYHYAENKRVLVKMWQDMPRVMLAKVAEMKALRRAFPSALGGLYVEEELTREDGEDTRVGEASKDNGRVMVSAAEKMVQKKRGVKDA